jgi:HEAT repeat protein
MLALCALGLPEALAGQEPKYVRTALEIVRAWGRALPIPVRPLLEHDDPGVRTAALAILPQVGCPRDHESEVRRLLSDAHEGVRAAAAEMAGRLRLVSALPDLRRCLRDGGPESSVAGAYALARLGPEGCDLLEHEILYSRTSSAAVALEAIEQLKSKRMLLAPL